MKNSYLLWIAFLALMLTIGTASAQEGSDRIAALKVSFITERLSLTPDEAKDFWPVFNEFEAKRKALREELKGGEQPQRLEFMTDAEAEKKIVDELTFEQRNLDLTKQYVGKFKEVLPVKKVAVLMSLEKHFSRFLLDKIKNKGNGPPPPGR